MKGQSNNMLFFYKGKNLGTVIQGLQRRSIVRTRDMLLAEQQTTDAGGANLLATDQQGSVLTVQADTDDEHHRFTPYGHDPTLNSEKNLTGFTGEYLEALSHYYLLGTGYHRSYHPALMRFVSPDSVSPFAEGGINAYAYCGGDPVNRIDPSGQNWFTSLFKGIGNALHFRRPGSSKVSPTVGPTAEQKIATGQNSPNSRALPSYTEQPGANETTITKAKDLLQKDLDANQKELHQQQISNNRSILKILIKDHKGKKISKSEIAELNERLNASKIAKDKAAIIRSRTDPVPPPPYSPNNR
ncbi:RHS repeat-associated core domain-containing protein [Pseudomonas sp. SWRI107]|uniref:RHS repeat-associated core domain-containing protein n=1 Tax=Pseudomonas farsensis TaxID=2745492 RepID=UPI001644112A|nr:RHS repeat-associated core domain-containing protein [Pseudomonas farsensis]MBV4532515.1 RHS repeat-associated core domain-containing protein [Pseudomonas farsensis]